MLMVWDRSWDRSWEHVFHSLFAASKDNSRGRKFDRHEPRTGGPKHESTAFPSPCGLGPCGLYSGPAYARFGPAAIDCARGRRVVAGQTATASRILPVGRVELREHGPRAKKSAAHVRVVGR